MVGRHAVESPSYDELWLATLGPLSIGLLGHICYRWRGLSGSFPIGRCTVRTDSYRDKSHKVKRTHRD
jgi:hypothetical protein